MASSVRQLSVGLVLAAALAVLPSSSAESRTAPWAGTWTTAWGAMTLTQHGSKVEGNYPRTAGHLVGSVSGNVLTGRWNGGMVVLALKANGRSFSGRSNRDAAPTSWSPEWSGTCSGGRCLTSAAPTTCTKTYVIEPSGKSLAAQIKLTELSPAQLSQLRVKENEKYAGFSYTPTGAPETRKQNCAGLVFETLFPGVVQPGNVEPDEFFRRVVQPYGKEVTLRKEGDVVVYINGNGVVKHVAIVESAPVVLGATKILTKDGAERPYIASFPTRLLPTNDPLVQAHADSGRVEFWRIDKSKLKIQEVSSGQCDAVAPPGAFTLVPSLTKVSNPNSNELTLTPTPTGQGIDDHTGKNGGAGNGGDWKVEYHWAVPTTLVPGKTAAIYMQIIVDSEEPKQPNGYQMNTLAPDFAQALPCHYPEQTSCSKTFQCPLAADQAGSKEIVVTVGVLSASVQFTYRPTGK